MFGSLVKNECSMWLKSIVFYAYVMVLLVFYISQMGGGTYVLVRPEPGEGNYGKAYASDENAIMNGTLKELALDFDRGEKFATYPTGFYKEVTLSQEEMDRLAECISKLSGMSRTEWENALKEYLKGCSTEIDSSGRFIEKETVPWSIVMDSSVSYEQFENIMQEVADMIGPGSAYAKDSLWEHGVVDKTYEQALADYEDVLYRDKVSGAFARLFCDYMGIILGLLPAFLGVARVLKDKRSQAKGVIYSKKASAAAIVCSRYAGMIIMMLVPLLLLSILPMTQTMYVAKAAGVNMDYFAYIKYTIGWVLPTLLFVTAAAYVMTEVTESLLAILVSVTVWFVAIFSASGLVGAGWNMIPRFNRVGDYQIFMNMLPQLIKNRILYTAAALALLGVTVLVYAWKRKGAMGYDRTVSKNFRRLH